MLSIGMFSTFTHGCMEPIVIASNRQLSGLHPIRALLDPYFKDTLAINAAARAVLINAAGTIEQNFSMGKYAFQVGTAGYGAFWQFDTQALPQNLIARYLFALLFLFPSVFLTHIKF